MSKAPKQRKAQLHYQPYQPSGGASNTLDGNGASSGLLSGGNSAGAQSQGNGAAMDYGLSDLMDPVLTGYSSNLSRNLWDDWNENDPNLVKFDMFSDDGLGTTAMSTTAASSMQSTTSTTNSNSGMGFMASMMASHAGQLNAMPQQQQQQQRQQHNDHPITHHHQQHHEQHQQTGSDPMELDGPRAPTMNGFHSLPSQPRLSVKRSLSEDLVSMLDEEDGHDQDPFSSAQGGLNKPNLPRGLTFGQHYASSNANPLSHKPQQSTQTMQQPAIQRPPTQTPLAQQQQQAGQHLLVQHATDWLHGFPAGGMPPQQDQLQQQQLHQQHIQQQVQQPPPQPPQSPSSAAHQEAHNQRPDPSPMERASAAIASTLVAVPNPCKESAPPATSTTSTPVSSNAVTPSPFSAYSFMSAAMESAKSSAAGEGSSEAEKANNPFANAGMMLPGFMMYSMPMMGNYQAAAAAAAAMGMMPMGAMQMGPMGMPMPGMQMNAMGMPMGAMGVPRLGGMQMGMPMMQMAAASMGMPMAAMTGGVGLGAPATPDGSADTSVKVAPKALQPKGAVLAPAGTPSGSGGAANASFVSIARKPEEPEVSNILKSLMEEEAKKKEKKLERNRDSARESRKKQQTYVETLENGIKRLQINRDLVVSYRWGVTGGPAGPNGAFEWKERVGIISGRSEAFSTLQNPGNFQNLMRINRQRRALSLARDEKERAVYKCFLGIGKQLAGLRVRLLELQVFRNLSNPANAASQDLVKMLQLTEEQRLQLECHSNRVFDQQVLSMVKLFKVFFALRAQAIKLNLMSPDLERYFRDVCSMEQLQKLLQWTELHRSLIEGGDGPTANANALSLIS